MESIQTGIEERLEAVLAGCAWVREPDLALSLLPSLAADLPPLVPAGEGAGLALPLACAEEVTAGVCAVLGIIGEKALSGQREDIQSASWEALLGDPLVPTLAGLLAAADRPGLRSHAVPALAVAWATARLLGGSREQSALLQDGTARRVAERLQALDPAPRAAALASIAWSFSGRLAAAGALARQAGALVRVGGLSRAVLTNPLVLTFPAGKLRDGPGLALAAAACGQALEEPVLGYLQQAAAAAIAASEARRAAGKERPADAELRAIASASNPLFRPGVGPRILALLPDLASAEELAAGGLPREAAAALTRPAGARAAASAWTGLLLPLLRWDILAAICACASPLGSDGGRWRTERGPLPPGVPWELLAPTLRPAPPATVVAVRLSGLRQRVEQAAADQRNPLLRSGLDRLWRQLLAQTRAVAARRGADHGIAAFSDPIAAVAFAHAALRLLRSSPHVDMGELGDPIPLRGDLDVSVGIATGGLDGATDGEAVVLEGEAVGRAIALSGVGEGAPPAGEGDPLGVRGAWLGAGGLHSRGIVADEATTTALLERVQAARGAVHLRGGTARVAEVSADFQLYPVAAWWESGGGVLALLPLQGGHGGACELLAMEQDAFAELHQSDGTLARSRAPAPPAAPLAPEGRTPEGRTPEGRTPEGRTPEGRTPPPAPIDPFTADDEDEDEPADPFLALGEDTEEGEAPLAPFADPFRSLGGAGRADDDDAEEGDISFEMGEDDLSEESDGFDPPRAPPSLEPAGFSLGGDPSDGGFDQDEARAAPPMLLDDDDDDGGSVVGEADVPEGPDVSIEEEEDWDLQADTARGPAEAAPAPAPPEPPRAGSDFLSTDIAQIFRDYVTIEEDGQLTFGLVEGDGLRDAHSYDIAGNVSQVYRRFLAEKLQEGFMPQVHRTHPVHGIFPVPLDLGHLEQAYVALMGRQPRRA